MKKQRINLFLKEEQLLSDAQMNVLHGGGSPDLSPDKACSCGCQGNSSTADNKMLTLKVDLQPLALRHVTVFSSQLLLHGELQKVKGH